MLFFSMLLRRITILCYCITVFAVVQGCAINGGSFDEQSDEFFNQSATMASNNKPWDETVSSDQSAIRAQVASLADNQIKNKSIKWHNEKTGSKGEFLSIEPVVKNNLLCRRFKTTREAFDGVALYLGYVCKFSENVWVLSEFERFGG